MRPADVRHPRRALGFEPLGHRAIDLALASDLEVSPVLLERAGQPALNGRNGSAAVEADDDRNEDADPFMPSQS